MFINKLNQLYKPERILYYTEVTDDELGDEIFNEFIKRQDETEE